MFYPGTFIIEQVISHSPAIPSKASEIEFIIKWEGYDSSYNTRESWKNNHSLRTNEVVLKYMLSNASLKRFVPTNIVF